MRAEHLHCLDGWRGLAIGLLLIGHYFPYPGINFGAVGVKLFFVLSGLLMARFLFLQEVGIGTFYRRRIARIMPAVYFFLFAVVAAMSLLHREINWHELLAAALFMNNYFPGELGHTVMPFGHICSLSVEEHRYILFVLGGVYYWTQYGGRALSGHWLHSAVSACGIFASAFLILHLQGRRHATLRWPAYTALLALGLATQWWSHATPLQIFLGGAIFALLVKLLPSAPTTVQALLASKPLRTLGLWAFDLPVAANLLSVRLRRSVSATGRPAALRLCRPLLLLYAGKAGASLAEPEMAGHQPAPQPCC